MRLRRLDLIAYGPFSDRSLDFRADADLHLIYGPNEAGKSSALRAITDLLFGFVERPADDERSDFLHQAKARRVAACLQTASGPIDCRRRPGRKSTLLSNDEAEDPIGDDRLTPFLGGLDRAAYERSFGLDSLGLRAGGHALALADGESGESLLLSATGIVGLHERRQSIEAEAQTIFASRKSQNRTFYAALDRYEEARRELKDNTLRAPEWKRLEKDLAETEDARKELESQSLDLRRQIAELEQLQRLHPIIRSLDALAPEIAGYDHLEGLSVAFGEQVEAVRQRSRDAAKEVTRAGERQEELRAEIETMEIDQPILDHRDRVQSLISELAVYNDRGNDLPRREAELLEAERELARFRQDYGFGASEPDEVGQDNSTGEPVHDVARPTLPDLAELDRLVEEGREFDRRLQSLDDQADALAKLDAEEADDAAETMDDPAELRQIFEALRPELDELTEAARLRDEGGERKARVVSNAEALDPALPAFAKTVEIPLPGGEAVRETGSAMTELAQRQRATQEAIAERQGSIAQLTSERAEFEAGGSVTTRDALEHARAERDGTIEAEPFDRDAARMAIALTDDLTDRLIDNADRAAAYASLMQRIAAEEAGLEQDRSELDLIDRRLTETRSRWQELFAPFGIEPASPPSMDRWLQSLGSLRDAWTEADGMDRKAARLEERADEARPSMDDLAAKLDVQSDTLPLAALRRRLEQELAKREERWASAERRRGAKHDRSRRRERIEKERLDLDEQRERWSDHLAGHAGRWGIDPAAGLTAVETAVDYWRFLPDKQRTRDDLRHRVEVLQTLRNRFETELRTFCGELAPELQKLEIERAVADLRNRLEAAKSAKARFDDLTSRERKAREAVDEAKRTAAASTRELDELLQQVPDDLDPASLVEMLRKRDDLVDKEEELRSRVREAGNGQSEEDIRAKLTDFDPLEAEGRSRRRQERVAEIERERDEKASLSGELREKRRVLEGGEGAELSAFKRAAAEQEMVDEARHYLRLKAQSILLGAAMEHYAKTHGDSVLQAAGQHFAALTGQAFAGLAQRVDTDGIVHLTARRADGDEVDIRGGLSEGTRDQLYLALRLAWIGERAATQEVPPLIGDDIFMTFDDRRTAAGLDVMASMATTVQPILFTHHRSVVDIAKKRLGERLDLIEMADG